MMPTPGTRVRLGKVVATPAILGILTPQELTEALSRHQCGDWGDVDQHDWEVNDFSLRNSLRLLSAYKAQDGTKFWIITEADRSSTCVLLPGEY
jgi:hypothetical protein